MAHTHGIDGLIGRMENLLAPLQARGDPGRFFLATYLRTTQAVKEELDRGGFRDTAWVERWDVAFADLYLDALEAARPAGARRSRGRSRSAPVRTTGSRRCATCCSA